MEGKHGATDPCPFKCRLCDYAGAQQAHLDQHMAGKHGATGSLPFTCRLCAYAGAQQAHLDQHMEGKHGVVAASSDEYSYSRLSRSESSDSSVYDESSAAESWSSESANAFSYTSSSSSDAAVRSRGPTVWTISRPCTHEGWANDRARSLRSKCEFACDRCGNKWTSMKVRLRRTPRI